MQIDFLIVGSGLTGTTIARLLHDKGFKVLVVDRRSHLGGNVYDRLHHSGIRINTYGPHYFRTTSKRLWEFVNRFSKFYKYEAEILTLIDSKFEHWPIIQTYINEHCGANWKPEFTGIPSNFEEACLAKMPRVVYMNFVKNYTEKQWGAPSHTLSSELAGRFTVHADNDTRLKNVSYQGIPVDGYTGLMTNLLQGIPLILNFDYLNHRNTFIPKFQTVFTGPIDEYFGFDIGKLAYRGQIREHIYYPESKFIYPKGQINTPSHRLGSQIRYIEWKHMMLKQDSQRIKGTVITSETPYSPDHTDAYEYPFPDSKNNLLYKRYYARTASCPNVLFCGRLGEYKYYDMDQAISRAMLHADRLIELREGITSIPIMNEREFITK
ncbi:UDP-galactopyranose mutase [Dendronalium sp. ChiSLP03b]|uniref:UDP-galactopyranose mutase n=1 Tax=Dendronalium sp. ChiSLP03b TaxID=3075381 RepID=UPI002AD4EAB1|nr:UDP-galactopyranose mutase [Dendronalium sp. ChiSLP03b]MDZ8207242.1 UDP-galactopyranose mutase [Dendronalium sp. ChiSLP03b]